MIVAERGDCRSKERLTTFFAGSVFKKCRIVKMLDLGELSHGVNRICMFSLITAMR
ncbi:hypothetical protein F7888_07920 [Bacillus sp. PS06]|nr:hypothetical protein [Bacillus sp. PS06]